MGDTNLCRGKGGSATVWARIWSHFSIWPISFLGRGSHNQKQPTNVKSCSRTTSGSSNPLQPASVVGAGGGGCSNRRICYFFVGLSYLASLGEY